MNALAPPFSEAIGRYCLRALVIGLVSALLCPAPVYSQNAASAPADSGSASGGDSGDTPTFKKDVKVVNVFATVRDKKGQIVPDLAKDDFLLQVEGRPE